MTKFIKERIKEKIKISETDYADAYIASVAYSTPEYIEGNPDAKPDPETQLDSAKRMMDKAMKRIKLLKSILKDLTKDEG